MPSSMVTACRAALARLNAQQPLDTKDLHRVFYRDRGEPTMEKLRLQLELGAMKDKRKLVFSGHIGSGKSSELFNLKRQLDEKGRATILYFPVRKHVNLVGMDGTRLLEAMARELETLLNPGPTYSATFDEELRRASETYKRVRIRKEGISGNIGIKPEIEVLSVGAGLTVNRGTEQQWTYEDIPDASAMLELVNARLKSLRERRGKDVPVLLICDDLEKLDPKTAEVVFSDGLALSEVDACVIYTAPIALLYSERSKTLLGHFEDDWTLLPIIKVRDSHGNVLNDVENDKGISRLRKMILPRLPEVDEVLSKEAFERLALSSGGVLRDLVRMLREVCLLMVAENLSTRLEKKDMKKAEAEIRRAFGRQVPSSLVPRLARLDKEDEVRGMDPELARLLNLAAVLEYANDETWYRVHPMARHLIGADDAE